MGESQCSKKNRKALSLAFSETTRLIELHRYCIPTNIRQRFFFLRRLRTLPLLQPTTCGRKRGRVWACVRGGGEEGRGEIGGRGHRGSRRDGVNTPAYMDWANIQFVPPRLSSTVAATQFLPIDLPATGTIAPGDATSPEYGAASQPVSQPASKRARE